MIKSFDEYFGTVNEAFNLKDVKFQKKTRSEIYTGFKNLGYKCLGTFYWKYKSYNNVISPMIKDFLIAYLMPIEDEVYGKLLHFGKYRDGEAYVNGDGLTVEWYSKFYGETKDGRKYVHDLIRDNVSNEKVVKIKNGSRYDNAVYCFWNPTEKYYYYMDMECCPDLFTEYVTLKTENLDTVKAKYTKWKIDRENFRIKQKEQDEIKDVKSRISDDFKKNENKYKRIEDISELPENIQNDLNNECGTCEYFMTSVSYSSYGYCGRGAETTETYHIINNRDLADGYYFTSSCSSNWTGD